MDLLSPLKIGVIACILCLAAGFLLGYQVGKGKTPEPVTVQLPPKVVEVKVVKTIPGPTKYRVVERIKFQTKSVEVPVEKIVEVSKFIDPIGRVRLEANKFEGLKDGKPAFGWKGNAVCEFAPKDKPTAWLKLVESPFDLTESKAETTIPPTPLTRKLRLDLSLGVTKTGLLTQVGLSRRLTKRSFLGKALLPDHVGVAVGYTPSSPQVSLVLGKEF